MLLSVDPGKRCGWCEIYTSGEKEGSTESGVIDGDDVYGVAYHLKMSATVLVIESQYAKRYVDKTGRSGINFKAVETLMLLAHRWIVLAELYGIEVVRVAPSVWQSYFHLKPGDKAAYNSLASSIAGRPLKPDEDVAVLIGEWYRLEMED